MPTTAGRFLEYAPIAAMPPAFASALHNALLTGLDRLAHGVAVLCVDGHVHYANASARALFARSGWPAQPTASSTNDPRWRAALHRCCASGRRELVDIVLSHSRVVAALTPLAVHDDNMALAVFGRDEICGSVELQLFALHHDLTGAETRVLFQLCRGLQASAIATENGVSRTTVLTQIAAIRSKTRFASVRLLVGALARMPQLAPLSPVLAGSIQ